VTAAQTFLSLPSALIDGKIAFSDRAIGDLARPFFPDASTVRRTGPSANPTVDGVYSPPGCSSICRKTPYCSTCCSSRCPRHGCGFARRLLPASASRPRSPPRTPQTGLRLANGLQIFPGSVPIYRGSDLVGAVGVSGDGVDQDDMIAFLGLQRAISALGGSLSQAPAAIRADTLTPKGTRLQYVQCPQSPLINSSQRTSVRDFERRRNGRQRRAIALGATVPLLAALLGWSSFAAAETCYKDESGRIVTRRRPGLRGSAVSASRQSQRAGTGSDNDRGKLPTAFTGGQDVPDRGPRPAASPVPLPGSLTMWQRSPFRTAGASSTACRATSRTSSIPITAVR